MLVPGRATPATPDAVPAVAPQLACPLCTGELQFSSVRISCASCRLDFPQPDPLYIDLLPGHLMATDDTSWSARQQQMDAWYDDLIRTPSKAVECFVRDYEPFAPLLPTLRGAVIDAETDAALHHGA